MLTAHAFPKIPSHNKENPPAVFSAIFSQFKKHMKVVHYDNSSIDMVTPIVKNQNIVLFNYDSCCHKIKLTKERRPFLHLLLITNKLLYNKHVNSSALLNIDVVFLVLMKENYGIEHKLCALPHLQQASAVFIYDFINSKVWFCCYFCGNVFTKIIKIESPQGTIPKFYNYQRNYTNFKGYKFTVGYTEMLPLIFAM